jgi:hypothetical protein
MAKLGGVFANVDDRAGARPYRLTRGFRVYATAALFSLPSASFRGAIRCVLSYVVVVRWAHRSATHHAGCK